MDIKTIDRIVWWVPFKKLRNDIRDLMNYIYYNDSSNHRLFQQWELRYIAPFRKCIKNDKYFVSKYKNLIFNLDKESLDTVTNIISKVSSFNDINDNIYFSTDEMKLIKYTKQYMQDKIIKINDNCYMFDNKYILNKNYFEIFTFHPKHQLGISYLKNQDKIKEKSIIDAGAWIGDTAIFLSHFTKNKVYAFEPLYENYNEMIKNIELNDVNNIEPMYMALGEENKKIYLENMPAGHMMKINTNLESIDGKMEVEMVTLDKFV